MMITPTSSPYRVWHILTQRILYTWCRARHIEMSFAVLRELSLTLTLHREAMRLPQGPFLHENTEDLRRLAGMGRPVQSRNCSRPW